MKLNFKISGDGEPIILLHGMAASLHYWDAVAARLEPDYRVIRLDLFGFGDSPKPDNSTYDYRSHCQVIIETLDQLDLTSSAVLVGHSMGALIAARLAADYPDRFKQVVLIAPPIYASPAEAKLSITQGKRAFELAYYGPTSQILCTMWCRWLRPVTQLLAPLYLPQLPKRVTRDTLKHTWRSFSQSREYILERGTAIDDLGRIKPRVQIVYGDEDLLAREGQLPDSLKNRSNITITTLSGGHHLPVDQAEEISSFITLTLR